MDSERMLVLNLYARQTNSTLRNIDVSLHLRLHHYNGFYELSNNVI